MLPKLAMSKLQLLQKFNNGKQEGCGDAFEQSHEHMSCDSFNSNITSNAQKWLGAQHV